jgi:phage terminase large subunit-like protein
MWNIERAERIIQFIETLSLPDGSDVGRPFVLRDWQRELIIETYAPAREDGRRQVRQAVLSMARKNGKTALVAALCLAHLCGPEAIRNGQLYSVAFDREQAGILFRYMAQMVYMDDELSSRLKVVESRKRIVDPISGSDFQALSSETRGKHGKSSSFIAFDELAQFGADRELYDVMMTSRGAHAEPLVWVFSTQADNDFAVLSELIDYGKRVKSGEIDDPTFKLFLYETPTDADLFDEEAWKLANPALGDFRSLDEMREYAERAKHLPGAEAAFRNLYLNQRVAAAELFISPEVWTANAGEPDMSVFDDEPAYAGLDLSAKNDLTAMVLVAQGADGAIHVRPYFWCPEEGLKEREAHERVPYWTWRKQGFIETTPGRTVDYGWVAERIAQLASQYRIAGIKFDRWRIDDLRRELDRIGVQTWVEGKDDPLTGGLRLIPHGQGYRDMNPAVEVLEDLLLQGRLRHGGHPVLTYCAASCRVQKDPAGNRKFDKVKSTGRIDGIVALAMALNGAVVGEPAVDGPSIYEMDGIWD